jgi:hypothetical protein
MKRGTTITIIFFTLVALILTGCQAEIPQEEVQEEVILGPAEPVLISGIPSEFLGDNLEEPLEVEETEEVIEEETEEVVEEETEEAIEEEIIQEDKVTIRLELNKPYNFKGKIVTLTEHREATFIEFNVDGIQSRFIESRKSEIVNGLRVKYERSYYSKDGTVEVTLEEFKLGNNEYLLDKKATLKVKNHTLSLSDIKFDEKIWDGVVWFSLSGETAPIIYLKPGETKPLKDLSITLIEPFWRSGIYYAHVKVE